MSGALARLLKRTDNDGHMTVTSEEQRVTENTILDVLKHYKPGLVDDGNLLAYNKFVFYFKYC